MISRAGCFSVCRGLRKEPADQEVAGSTPGGRTIAFSYMRLRPLVTFLAVLLGAVGCRSTPITIPISHEDRTKDLRYWEPIRFQPKSAALDPSQADALRHNVRVLFFASDVFVSLESIADDGDSPEENESLSRNRIAVVREYLVQNAIAPWRVNVGLPKCAEGTIAPSTLKPGPWVQFRGFSPCRSWLQPRLGFPLSLCQKGPASWHFSGSENEPKSTFPLREPARTKKWGEDPVRHAVLNTPSSGETRSRDGRTALVFDARRDETPLGRTK